jgi:aspartate/glutamate racemase
VPDEEDLGKIFHFIMTELGCPADFDPMTGKPQFKASTKSYFLDVIQRMVKEKGADCVVLGCTEIELLVF